jgi:hypothetical protein
LVAVANSQSKERRSELFGKQTVQWQDLDVPVDILRRAAAQFGCEVDGLEQVPHDLWAGATLPEATIAEAVSLVLIQFDLTFAWGAGAERIEVVPIPSSVVFEKAYTPSKMSAAEAARFWASEVEGLIARVKDKKVLVQGTVEQHEALEHLLNPQRAAKTSDKKPKAPVPLERREFSLNQSVPPRALLQELEKSGIRFVYDKKPLLAYDSQTLRDRKIDLETPIEIHAEKSKAPEFLHKIFDPLELTFEIDGLTVTLTSK